MLGLLHLTRALAELNEIGGGGTGAQDFLV